MFDHQVTITEEGRSGAVVYTATHGRITGWWEFAGGAALAIVSMGSAAGWARQHPWAVARRDEILRAVGEAVVRQKAAGHRALIDAESGMITITR